MAKIKYIEGKITTEDGEVSLFIIYGAGDCQQWGARTERLGQTVDAVTAMATAVADKFDNDEEETGS